jgi:hypothetical protein
MRAKGGSGLRTPLLGAPPYYWFGKPLARFDGRRVTCNVADQPLSLCVGDYGFMQSLRQLTLRKLSKGP